jgi:hypothetical protein
VSEPTDIKALDEYLKGHSDVSQRYRELGGESVPPELDRRVLAAAREAVANEGAKGARSWLRWSAPIALAASVVLVLTVVLESGLQKDTPVPAKQPQPVQVVPIAIDDARPLHADVPPTPEPAVADVRRQLREYAPPPEIKLEDPQTASNAIATVAQPAAPPPAAAPEVTFERKSVERSDKSIERSEAEADVSGDFSEVTVTGTHMRRGAGRAAAGSRSAIAGEAFSSKPQEERADRADPQAWLEQIRELRRTGKSDEADREWQRFREAFPDFQVADDDIARQKP